MVLFGWKSLLLLKILAHEAGLAQPNENVNYHIEIRQKYFYLNFIPFFPMGKMYLMRNHTDNELYELTPETLAIIKQKFIAPRAPWYTYSWIILITLLIVGLIMQNS